MVFRQPNLNCNQLVQFYGTRVKGAFRIILFMLRLPIWQSFGFLLGASRSLKRKRFELSKTMFAHTCHANTTFQVVFWNIENANVIFFMWFNTSKCIKMVRLARDEVTSSQHGNPHETDQLCEKNYFIRRLIWLEKQVHEVKEPKCFLGDTLWIRPFKAPLSVSGPKLDKTFV